MPAIWRHDALSRIWHGVRVEVSPPGEPPFPIDALVVEDDTWQVLGADPGFRPTVEHPIRLMQALREAEPFEPGTVAIKEDAPVRLHAIVHDLDCEPSCQEEWIAAALGEILRIATERSFRSLGLPQLGTRYGRLTAEEFMRILDGALEKGQKCPLQRLWLLPTCSKDTA